MEPEVENSERVRQPELPTEETSSRWLGYSLLAVAILFVAVGLYRYQFGPLLDKSIPEHQFQPLDTPPIELTSFSVRHGGEDLTPQCLEVSGDSLFVTFAGQSLLQIYSRNLDLLKNIQLERPAVLQPTAFVLTDSLLIAADTVLGTIAVYDRDGYYRNSASWYPDHQSRVRPVHLSVAGGFLYATDITRKNVAKISLIKREPFYDFLELVAIYPQMADTMVKLPTCAMAASDGKLWIGDSQPGGLFTMDEDGKFAAGEKPPKSRMAFPCDFAESQLGDDVSSRRIHLLDRVAGKVFVYDESGKLRLVYPRERELLRPTGIAIDPEARHIFVTESEKREITVFGY
ncbi:MAG: hypothetical protein WBP29_06935 [Candidatus Zixiibacteriota bacterium]